MTENERSANNLEWWIGVQTEMKDQALHHLASLQIMAEGSARASATGAADSWLSDAISEQSRRIDRLDQSIMAAQALRHLAIGDRLHNPLRS